MAGFGRKPAFDFGQHLESLVGRLEAVTGYKLQDRDIPESMSFREWCESLAEDRVGPKGEVIPGMKIDGKPFSLKDRPALIPLYDRIPTTVDQARGFRLVVMKATQLGLTVWEVLANLYCAIKFGPVTIGMFMPDQATASYKSEYRFMRIVRSVPQLLRRLTHRMDAEGEHKVGEGNILTRTVGESILLFLWTSGKVTTESRPLERKRDEALEQLYRQAAKPLVDHALNPIRQSLRKHIKDTVTLHQWFEQVQREVLDNLALFLPQEGAGNEAELQRQADLEDLLALCQVNLAVDNAELRGAPVVVEDNPQLRSLFGHIEHQADSDSPQEIGRASCRERVSSPV